MARKRKKRSGPKPPIIPCTARLPAGGVCGQNCYRDFVVCRNHYNAMLAAFAEEPRKREKAPPQAKQRHSNKAIRRLRSMPYAEYLKSPHWKQLRIAKLKAARYTCEHCGQRNAILHVHHVTYDRRGCERMSDLRCLCEQCHCRVHGITE